MLPFPTKLNPRHWHRHKSERRKLDGVKFDVFEMSTGTQPEKVFYYWNGNDVDLKLDDALNFFLTKIGLTKNWTDIFTYGKLLYKTASDYVWYQRYEPAVVSARNLIGIYAVNHLDDSILPDQLKGKQCVLISLRSVPKDLINNKSIRDLLKALPYWKQMRNEPQIVWHGAYLLVGNGDKTSVHKFDSEDEGGWLPQFVTNFAFPKYVQDEAILATQYIRDHKGELTA